MKLSDKITGSYSVMNPIIARDKLSFVQNARNLVSDLNTTDDRLKSMLSQLQDLLMSRDDNDISSFCDVMSEMLKNIETIGDSPYRAKFIQILFMIRILVDTYYDRNSYNSDVVSKLKGLLDCLESKISNDFIDDTEINNIQRCIGTKVLCMYHKNLGDALYTHIYITPLDKKNDINNLKVVTINESADSGVIIKSIANYSTTKYFPQLTEVKFSPEGYVNGIYNENDDDYIINRIQKLPEFLKSILNRKDCYDLFIHVCEYLYDKFTNNHTALGFLKEAMDKCISVIDSTTMTEYEQKNICDSLRSYCEKFASGIDDSILRLGEKQTSDYSPLIEMGFGFIYDILPSNIDDINSETIDTIGTAMIEAVNEHDVYNLLTEVSNRDIRREIKRDTENDIYRQRLQNKYYDERRDENDEYEDERRAQNDKYEDKRRLQNDKYEDKRRMKNDKYEEKQRRKQEEYEKKKEEKERKKNATKTAWAKWKTMKLTVPAVFSATRALKRLLTATAVGGVAYAAGFNPVFLPVIYLISRYMGDKTNPEGEKLKIMKEIKETQNIIESKIEQAERQNDMKQKYQLMRMRDKLDSQFKRFGYSSPSATGGMIK